MKDIDKALKDYGISEIEEWCDKEYEEHFAKYFKCQEELYSKFTSGHDKITDSELESVLTDIPLDLFKVSEILNKYRLSVETIKLRIKEKEKRIPYSDEYADMSETVKKNMAELSVIDDKIILNAFTSIITRVENQISFSREFIMGAKKIWDSRRKGESVNPVNPIDTQIDGQMEIGQYYVK